MKTHEMARHLEALARALRQAPNIDLVELGVSLAELDSLRNQAVATSLESLLSFSKFSKAEWAQLIEDYSLPIEVKSSHSARDLVGKVLNCLDDNPEILDQIKSTDRKVREESNLTKAIRTLIEG